MKKILQALWVLPPDKPTASPEMRLAVERAAWFNSVPWVERVLANDGKSSYLWDGRGGSRGGSSNLHR